MTKSKHSSEHDVLGEGPNLLPQGVAKVALQWKLPLIFWEALGWWRVSHIRDVCL